MITLDAKATDSNGQPCNVHLIKDDSGTFHANERLATLEYVFTSNCLRVSTGEDIFYIKQEGLPLGRQPMSRIIVDLMVG